MSEEDIQAGDVVLFNTGWGSLWMVDNEKFNNGAPGIELEVVPNPDPELAFPVHQELITKNGIHIQENLDLPELVEDEVYEFAYIYIRMPLVGATGSAGSPIAVR